jgi:ubiquinone/menaquinone biosynthesis C-methylase UbiE
MFPDMLFKYVAQQIAKPKGLLGKYVLGPLWNTRNKELNDSVFEALHIEPGDRILEIGFGGGYLISRLIKKITNGKVVGVDISKDIVRAGQIKFERFIKNGKMELKCAKAETLPFPAKFFTKVCSINSIFYWESINDAFSEMYRVLEQDGEVVICFTSKKSLEKKKLLADCIKLYDKEDVVKILHKSGFRQIEDQKAADKHREYFCITGIKRESPIRDDDD